MAKKTTARIDGINEYTLAISRLKQNAREAVIDPAIYTGASILMDAVREELKAVPIDGGDWRSGRIFLGPNQAQKDALLTSLGKSPITEDGGYRYVGIGFTGYNKIVTKRWPNGQPNAMVARSVEKGTTFMLKHPFMKKALSRVENRMLNVMKTVIDMKIYALMNNK